MKPAQIFHQYIWIINTLRSYNGLTINELNRKWIDDGVADGNPLQRSSFNRHRDAYRLLCAGLLLSHFPSNISLTSYRPVPKSRNP